MFFPEKLTCMWLKQAYKNGLKPEELIDEIIKRTEMYKDYHIWIVKPTMEILKQYFKKLPADRESLPLWGIPFAVKDNIDVANMPTTAACPDYSYIPTKNAFVVQQLIQAGAIPIGKTNLDQFATGLVGTRSPYGEVYNAYQSELISGGSSSGSAVSVALGMAAFSLGTDTAGSGRVPAMLNTLVGLKPAIGSWSTSGVVPACASLDCVTVFANNIQDAELIDTYAKGYDKECAWSRIFEEKGKILPKKVYLPMDEPTFYGDFAKQYQEKWNKAVCRIKRLGIKVEYIHYQMFEKAALILYEGAYVAERWQDLKDFIESHPKKIFPVTEKILRSGGAKEQTASKLFGNLHELQAYKQKTSELLKDSVMIMPTAGGTFTREQVRQNPIDTNSQMGLYTNHCNLLDLMAVAVPENSTDYNYPFGITVFGRSDNKNLVLSFAEKFLSSETMPIAVCGLHKKGRALEYQLTELGAEFEMHTHTSNNYKLYELNTLPVKPGMIRSHHGETKAIEVDLYTIPKINFGKLMEQVSQPLSIGDIQLEDGRIVKGFLCENAGLLDAKDITQSGKF